MSVTTINMQSHPATCFGCGGDATGLNHGIPVYEDLVLHNDYQGELGGAPACQDCFDVQSKMAKPMTRAAFLRDVRWHRKRKRVEHVNNIWNG